MKTTDKKEVWKFYHEEGYLVSNKGRWFSLKTMQELKQRPNNKGYLRAELLIAGERRFPFTHITVVALFGDKNGNSFEGNSLIDKGLSIDHLNRCKKVNCISNLEIVTHQENCIRRFRTLEEIGL